MGEEYFVIRNSEDGIKVTGPFTRERIEHFLNSSEFGADVRCLTEMPACYDGQLKCEDNEILIIRGSIVTPQRTQWRMP